METIGNLRRSHYCEQITQSLVGSEIIVAGSIAKCRDKGGVVFADLRDSSGLLQLTFDERTEKDVFEKAQSLKSEYVIIARGILHERKDKTDKIATGAWELFPTELRILSGAKTTPFEVRDEIKVNDELRLKYRYLDLRRPAAHSPIVMRSKIAKLVRDYYCDNYFCEIETPVLIGSSPEGARDYLVPSRVQQGKFYALPQSPQLYKQLLMLSGFDRYFQIAKCFRDEDLRADRQPEFTQIDMEMAFVDESDIMSMNEGLVKHVFKAVLNIDLHTPFLRMPYTEAMNRYGSDKPDTRFDMELCDITKCVANSEFVVFKGAIENGGTVRGINAKNLADKLTRKEIDKLVEVVKTYGAKGLAYTRLTADSETSSFEKFLSAEEIASVRTTLNAQTNDVILIVADADADRVFAALGALRLELGKRFELIDTNKFNFLWVTDFPLFEHDAENDRYVAKHHPFTMPRDEDMDKLESDPAACRAKAYDMVLNGSEIGGGSIRINNPELQARMFDVLGFTKERAVRSFGYLMEAYEYGAPPHGGMAFGLDRLVMELLKIDNIRDVVAFPKIQNASEVMTNCPDYVEDKQLAELGISVTQ